MYGRSVFPHMQMISIHIVTISPSAMVAFMCVFRRQVCCELDSFPFRRKKTVKDTPLIFLFSERFHKIQDFVIPRSHSLHGS